MNPAAASAIQEGRQHLARFLRWWQAGLVAWLPERLRSDPASGVVELRPDDLAGTPAAATQGSPEQLAPAVFVLDSEQVLVRHLSLPLAAEPQLRQVLGFELGRRTPFEPSEAYYGWRILDRRSGERALELELYVAPRDRVDAWREQLRMAGYEAVRIDVQLEDGARAGVDLLEAEARSARSKPAARLNQALAALVVLLLALVLLLPVNRARNALADLEAEAAMVRAETLLAEQQLRQLRELQGGVDTLLAQRRLRPPAALVLAELAASLPDGTWLDHVEIGSQRVVIQGESNGAAALVSLLEGLGSFDTASFEAPVTTDPVSGMERFRIAMRLAEEWTP